MTFRLTLLALVLRKYQSMKTKNLIKNTYVFFITCEILIDKKQPTKILGWRLRIAEEFFPLSLIVYQYKYLKTGDFFQVLKFVPLLKIFNKNLWLVTGQAIRDKRIIIEFVYYKENKFIICESILCATQLMNMNL